MFYSQTAYGYWRRWTICTVILNNPGHSILSELLPFVTDLTELPSLHFSKMKGSNSDRSEHRDLEIIYKYFLIFCWLKFNIWYKTLLYGVYRSTYKNAKTCISTFLPIRILVLSTHLRIVAKNSLFSLIKHVKLKGKWKHKRLNFWHTIMMWPLLL